MAAREEPDECVFCKIIRGEVPRSLVYEDDVVLSFPVLNPINQGHLVVIPRVHAPYLADLDDETAMHVMKISKRMARAIRESAYPSEGISLHLSDGEAANQEIFHFHLHVYPRNRGDGFGFKFDPSRHFVEAKPAEMDAVAKEIRSRLPKGGALD